MLWLAFLTLDLSAADTLPVCSSIEDLQLSQYKLGPKAFEVDFQAQLTFAAKDFDVFFCQSGNRATMVYCSADITGFLGELRPGDRLRVRGAVPEGVLFVRAEVVELVESPAELVPYSLTALDENGLPINGLATVTARVKQIVHTQVRTHLLCYAGYIRIEVVIGDALPSSRAFELLNKTVSLYGAFTKPDVDPNVHYQLFLMSADQLQLCNPEEEEWPPLNADEFGCVEGRIEFSDGEKRVVLHDGRSATFLTHHLPEPLEAGQWVKAFGNMLDEGSHLDSRVIFVDEPPNSPKGGGAGRVAGIIRKITEIDRTLQLKIEDYGSSYHIVLPLLGNSAPRSAGFRVGDTITCSGVLCESVPNSFSHHLSGLTRVLFAASLDAVELKLAPLTVDTSTIAWGLFAISTIIIGTALWNRSLTRLVRERTRRLSEATQHLQASYETIPKGVLLVDAEEKIAAGNGLFWQMFELAPQRGESATIVLQQVAARDGLDAVLEQMLVRCRSNPFNSETQQARNSLKQTYELFTGPIIDQDNRWIGRVWSFEDVTDKLSVERKLIQAQKMDVVGKLAGGIAHDFNNMLNVIHTSLDMISRQISATECGVMPENCLANCRTYADSARLAAQSSSALTKHLLDFARQSELEFSVADLREIVHSATHLCQRTFDPKIEFDMQVGMQPLPVKVDSARLEQAILNCLVNSRDAMPNGGAISVLANLERNAQRGDRVSLTIADNGCGMPLEVQERVFEPFFTTKERGKGTGLGLSTTLGVIEQFGGRIEIQSRVGQGTSLSITLPLCSLTELAIPEDRNDHPLEVMIIDDEQILLESTAALIGSLGQRATCFQDGRKAIDWLKSGKSVDIVLLDVQMPGLRGDEVFRAIRELRHTVRIVVFSGLPIECKPFLAHEYDFDNLAFIQKPFTVSDLEWQLASVKDRRRIGSF